MQSWFRYSLAFFGLVLLLTGFIYVLGPASTRDAVRSGETQTGQILDPDHTLVSAGENPGNTGAPTASTESGTTTGAPAPGTGTLKSTHGTDKAGNQKTETPTTPGASPTPMASPAAKDAHKAH